MSYYMTDGQKMALKKALLLAMDNIDNDNCYETEFAYTPNGMEVRAEIVLNHCSAVTVSAWVKYEQT